MTNDCVIVLCEFVLTEGKIGDSPPHTHFHSLIPSHLSLYPLSINSWFLNGMMKEMEQRKLCQTFGCNQIQPKFQQQLHQHYSCKIPKIIQFWYKILLILKIDLKSYSKRSVFNWIFETTKFVIHECVRFWSLSGYPSSSLFQVSILICWNSW